MPVKYQCPKCEKRYIDWGAEKLGFMCPDCDEEKLVQVGLDTSTAAKKKKAKAKTKAKAKKKKPTLKRKAKAKAKKSKAKASDSTSDDEAGNVEDEPKADSAPKGKKKKK